HLSEGSADAGRSHEERAREAWRGPRVRRRRRAVLLAVDQQSGSEPVEPDCRDAGLPQHDDPQLEHDDQASGTDDEIDRAVGIWLNARPLAVGSDRFLKKVCSPDARTPRLVLVVMMMTIVVIEVVVVELLRDEIRSFERRL